MKTFVYSGIRHFKENTFWIEIHAIPTFYTKWVVGGHTKPVNVVYSGKFSRDINVIWASFTKCVLIGV